jgi:hypothetical protein
MSPTLRARIRELVDTTPDEHILPLRARELRAILADIDAAEAALAKVAPFAKGEHGEDCEARACEDDDCDCPFLSDGEREHRADLCDCGRREFEEAAATLARLRGES